MKKCTIQSNAKCATERSGTHLALSLSGELNAAAVAHLWPTLHSALQPKGIESISVQGSKITGCDGAGTALLIHIKKAAHRRKASLKFIELDAAISSLMDLYPIAKIAGDEIDAEKSHGFVEEVGKTAWKTLLGFKDHISFMGELTLGIFKTILHPADLRMKDFLLVVEASGAKALPIIAMLGFLIGLILAFQGAVLMAQFGAEIYIADFVGKSVVRELGPLITAIIVAGRTGSAFAAELGTMKVNEEIDALTTMGLDPVRFLVIPRVIGATLMTPLLAVLTNLFGMAGGAVVMRGLGFPLITYVNRVLASVTAADYFGGLIKATIFGLLISSAGCLCGLRTGEGASAVGNSATRAVVNSIIMIVIADGIFAVLFYYLGI